MNMTHLDANTIYLILLDLISETKRALIEQTDSGPRALPHLEAAALRFSVIVQGGKPFAAELAGADKVHDVGAVALELICDLHTLLATLPQYAHLGPPAAQVRSALTIGRRHARASYVNEAAEAARNRVALPDVADILREMPVTRGVSALDIAEMYVRGGEELRGFLMKRAEADAEAAAARAGGVGSALQEARQLIIRLRAMIENEVSFRDDLDDDLPLRIFSLLDGRLAAAAARTRRNAGGAAGEGAVADDEGVGQDASAAIESLIDGGARVGAAAGEVPQAQPAAGPDEG